MDFEGVMSQLWPDWSQGTSMNSRNNISMNFISEGNDGNYDS